MGFAVIEGFMEWSKGRKRGGVRTPGGVHAGGDPGVERWLTIANKQLLAKHPGLRRLDKTDLSFAAYRKAVVRIVNFCREEAGEGYRRRIEVQIRSPVGTSPNVEVNVHRWRPK